jgi:hypothetical protein
MADHNTISDGTPALWKAGGTKTKSMVVVQLQSGEQEGKKKVGLKERVMVFV